MIKCYLVTSTVDNVDVQTRGGKFIKHKKYIAKVSNRKEDIVEVLDETHNWIPFRDTTPKYHLSFNGRFDINLVFFARNKKSLSKLFGKEGSNSFKYAVAIQTIDDKLYDYRYYTHTAYLLDKQTYENKFVI